MTEQELKDIKAILVQEIDKTKIAIAEYKLETQPIAPDDSIGRISRMDAINNKSIVVAALRTQEKKLVGLLRVQGELGLDDFGRCRKCHREIPIQRIVLVPHNKFCVNCAQ